MLFEKSGRALCRRSLYVVLLIVLAAGLAHAGFAAADRDPFIEELMAGANGDSRVQFLVINQDTNGQNLWGPNGGAQSRAMLVFYDALGRETGIYKFPVNPPTGGTLRTLIATTEFASLSGAPTPDIVIPPMLNATSGKVCFRTNPANPVFARNECVSYGAFTGDPETNSGDHSGSTAAGAPAAPGGLPIVGTTSLRRTVDTGRNSDFALTSAPSPVNISGASFAIPAVATVSQAKRSSTARRSRATAGPVPRVTSPINSCV